MLGSTACQRSISHLSRPKKVSRRGQVNGDSERTDITMKIYARRTSSFQNKKQRFKYIWGITNSELSKHNRKTFSQVTACRNKQRQTLEVGSGFIWVQFPVCFKNVYALNFSHLYFSVYMCVGVHMPQCPCRGSKDNLWVPEFGFRSSGLTVSICIC